jgi:hypothetical protein
LAKNKDHSDLSVWMRVIYNLVENTIINTSDEFYKALFAINGLSQFDTPILATLKGDYEFSGFTGAQILEEKIKAHLLLKSHEWSDVIVEAEKHPFFDGQIGFLLNFAGILAFYREHEHCDWSEELDKQHFSYFKKYAKSAGEVFTQIRGSSSSINYLWERAVLSKGIYFTEKSGDRFNLLSSRDTRNNIPRDHSWRRLLRIGSSAIEQKQAYVKAVIDDPLFDPENIVNSLELICKDALNSCEIEDWCQMLIKHKELIAYCNQGFISINGHEIILLSQSQRNHPHSEFRTMVVESELRQNKDLLNPFTSIRLESVKSRDEKAFISVGGWFFDDYLYSIEIRKYATTFNIRFKGGNPSGFSDELLFVLDKQGFSLVESKFEDVGVHGYFAKSEQGEVKKVISKLTNLCSDLKELNNE